MCRYENDLDRICFAGNFLQCLEVVPRRREKDAGEAQRFRMEGNELFQKKKMAEAFRAYNTSVLRSPQDVSNGAKTTIVIINQITRLRIVP